MQFPDRMGYDARKGENNWKSLGFQGRREAMWSLMLLFFASNGSESGKTGNGERKRGIIKL